jgi:hypothetical protein
MLPAAPLPLQIKLSVTSSHVILISVEYQWHQAIIHRETLESPGELCLSRLPFFHSRAVDKRMRGLANFQESH